MRHGEKQNKTTAKRLRELRKDHNLNQEPFAEMLGYTPAYISMLERGVKDPSEKTARRIVKCFPGINKAWLLGESDYKTVNHEQLAAISEAHEESELLFRGLLAFAELTGYTIHKNHPDTISINRLDQTSVEINAESIQDYVRDTWTISHDGASVHLSAEKMNRFQNEVCDFVELKLKHLFAEKGENNG